MRAIKRLMLILYLIVIIFLLVAPLSVHALNEWWFDNDYGSKLELSSESLDVIIINIIEWALGLLGLISVIMVIYGGYTWLTSSGNEEKIKKAQGILKAAIIGLVIIILSWAILDFVHDVVINASS